MINLDVPPAFLTPADIREHAQFDQLGVINGQDDAAITDYLAAAVTVIEGAISRAIMRRRVQFTVDAPFARWPFPVGPVVSLDAVRVTAPDGTVTTLEAADLMLVRPIDAPMLIPAADFTWPDKHHLIPIEIDATCGIGDNDQTIDDFDPRIRQAVRYLATHFSVNRETVTEVDQAVRMMPYSMAALLQQARLVPGPPVIWCKGRG
ncbi:MAG: hypothetical protein AAGD13_00620 [Pseudomonadota bacterium]